MASTDEDIKRLLLKLGESSEEEYDYRGTNYDPLGSSDESLDRDSDEDDDEVIIVGETTPSKTAVEIIRSILDMSPTEAIVALYSAYKTEIDESVSKGAPLEIVIDDLIEANMGKDGVIESTNKRAIVNQLLIKAANKTQELFAIIEDVKSEEATNRDNKVHALWAGLFGSGLPDPNIRDVAVVTPESNYDANRGFDGRYFKLLVSIELAKILAKIPLTMKEGKVTYEGEEQHRREEYPWFGDASNAVDWENYVDILLLQVFGCFQYKMDVYHKCDVDSHRPNIPRYFYTKMGSTNVCLSIRHNQIYYWQLEENEVDAEQVRDFALAFGVKVIRLPTIDASEFEDQVKISASIYQLLVNGEYNNKIISDPLDVGSYLDYAASIKFIDYTPLFSNCISPIATTTTTKNSTIPNSIPESKG
jgi:hypothetical protein